MTRFHRHASLPSRLLHAVLLPMLALAVAGAPLLSAVAGIHDVVGHADDHAGGSYDHAAEAVADDADGQQMMHAVMLVAGCCGHSCAALPQWPQWPVRRVHDCPDARIDAWPADAATMPLLRPPITV